METRRRDFKKGVDVDDGRRRREAIAYAIRKDKKEENLTKRRNLLVNNFTAEETADSSTAAVVQDRVTVADIPALRAGLQDTDPSTQLRSLCGFRKILSVEKSPPVQQCIDCGAVPFFVSFLQRFDNDQLQFESAWALTNVASTDRTDVLETFGAIPHLVNLLRSPNPDVREQCAWCLGNVAGDGPALRDAVLRHSDVIPAILANISQPASISLLKNCVWTLSNFCRGKPAPAFSIVESVLPMLS